MSPTQKGGGWLSSNNGYESQYNSSGQNASHGILQYVYYLVIIIIVVLLLLVLVHYTIKPIFRLRPGDSGIISLPGSDDSVLYWNNPKSINIIDEIKTPLGTMTQNWSFLLDIQVDNPTANTGKPRILFTRGGVPTTLETYTTTDTILTLNPDFNVCVYLDPLINDLFVSIQIVDEKKVVKVKTITLPNIPVGKSIRLGVFIGSKVLEVYINGFLLSNKAFPDSIKNNQGSLQPPLTTLITTAQVSNLRVWGRPVSPAEFRSHGSPSNNTFEKKIIPDTCLISS